MAEIRYGVSGYFTPTKFLFLMFIYMSSTFCHPICIVEIRYDTADITPKAKNLSYHYRRSLNTYFSLCFSAFYLKTRGDQIKKV